MQPNVVFHNVDSSESLVSFINKRSKSLNKFLKQDSIPNWVIEQESKQFKPAIRVRVKNKILKISAQDRNVFKAVEKVLERAKRIIGDEHSKRSVHH